MSSGLHARHHSSLIASPLGLFDAHEAIATQRPLPAGAVGFIPSDFCLLGLPHQEPDKNHYQRNGGLVQMSMVADPRFGLPFGRVSRLLLIWITTQAVIQKCPLIDLGITQSDFFIQKLGLSDTGGENGSIKRYSEQLNRLLHTLFTLTDHRRTDQRFKNYIVAHLGPIFSFHEEQAGRRLMGPLHLDSDFFNGLSDHSVPIDLRAIRALQSTYALDLYLFLSYRLRSLKRPVLIKWPNLLEQVGYKTDPDCSGAYRAAKSRLLKNVREVQLVYPNAKLDITPDGLELHRSPASVPTQRKP